MKVATTTLSISSRDLWVAASVLNPQNQEIDFLRSEVVTFGDVWGAVLEMNEGDFCGI
jgi:hypothetical protein